MKKKPAAPQPSQPAAGGLSVVMKFDDGSVERMPLHEYLKLRDRAMIDVGRRRQHKAVTAALAAERSAGALAANKGRAKFPQDPGVLRAELEALMKGPPSRSEKDARGMLAKKYHGTTQRLGQILPKVR